MFKTNFSGRNRIWWGTKETWGNVWWKRIFLSMATIVVLHRKHMKLFKPFTPHIIAWSVRKGFTQSIRRAKEQKTRLQCLASAMPKPVMLSAHQEL